MSPARSTNPTAAERKEVDADASCTWRGCLEEMPNDDDDDASGVPAVAELPRAPPTADPVVSHEVKSCSCSCFVLLLEFSRSSVGGMAPVVRETRWTIVGADNLFDT